MPIYEFECNSCQKVEEKVFSSSECPKEIVCSQCEGEAKKIISKSSFILVGSGWCKDGYTSAKDKGRNCGVAV